MDKRAVVGPIVLVAILTGGYFIDQARKTNESRISGYFESQPSMASSRLGGRVIKILVREGDHVRTGQPLVILEDASYEATVEAQKMAAEQAKQQFLESSHGPRPEQIEQARQAVAQAQANYDKLLRGSRPEDIQLARQKLAQAEAIYRKVRAGSRPEEVAAAQAAANVALAKLQAAQRGLTIEERRQLKARLDAAQASLDLANKQLSRIQNLYNEGAVPKQQLDTAISNQGQAAAAVRDASQAYKRGLEGTPREELAQAQEAYKQAEAQLLLVRKGSRKEDIDAALQDVLMARENLALVVKGPRKEDIDVGKAALGQATAALDLLLNGSRAEELSRTKAAQAQADLTATSLGKNLAERIISSTTDATVDRVLVAEGDLLANGTPAVQLSDPSDIWLRVYLPEDQLQKVKAGDSADLAIDGITGLVKARVESVATQGEFTPANLQTPEERGKQVFGIRLRLAAPDPRVKAGMYATVRRMGRWP